MLSSANPTRHRMSGDKFRIESAETQDSPHWCSTLGEPTYTTSMKRVLVLLAVVSTMPVRLSAGVPSVGAYEDVPEREMCVPAIIKSDTQKLRTHDTVCMLQGSVEGLLLSVSIEGEGPSPGDEITVVARANDGTALTLHRMWAAKVANSDDYDLLYHLTIPYGAFLARVTVKWGSDEVTLNMTHRESEGESKITQPVVPGKRQQPPRH